MPQEVAVASPKSVKSASVVAPVAPAEVQEADVADPGEAAEMKAAQVEAQNSTPTQAKVKAFKPKESEPGEEVETVWIEIELVGEDDKPIPGEAYRLTMPDETVKDGTLDENGFVRVEGIEPGSVKVTFPNLDKDAWEPK